jgi:hypothetical protein
MSKYYEATNRNAQSCSFAGNGTVNPSSTAAADAAASSCISNPSAVFTPSAVVTTKGGATGKATATGKTGHANATFGNADALLGMVIMAVVSVIGGVWTLA